MYQVYTFFYHFYFAAQLVGDFTLSDLLDNSWSQMLSILSPGTCLQSLSSIWFSIPTARRFSPNVANSRCRAFRLSLFSSKKKSLRVCALGENWTREIDFSRHEDSLPTTPPGTPYVCIDMCATKSSRARVVLCNCSISYSRWPRRTSGSPLIPTSVGLWVRMPPWRDLEFFCKDKKDNCWEHLVCGYAQFDASRRGKKELKSLRD